MAGALSWLKRRWAGQDSSSPTATATSAATVNSSAKASQTKTQPIILSSHGLSILLTESFPDTTRGTCTWKTLFSAPATPTDSLTVGIASCPPRSESREGYLALHRHKQAEMYHIISGHGMVKIDGVEHEVSGGDMVFIPGDAEHGIWNVDGEKELRWLYCFPVNGFEEVVYRFSCQDSA